MGQAQGLAGCGGAAQTVVDRVGEAVVTRSALEVNALESGGIEVAQHGKQAPRDAAKIAARVEPENIGAPGPGRSGEEDPSVPSRAGRGVVRREAFVERDRRAWTIVTFQHARGELGGACVAGESAGSDLYSECVLELGTRDGAGAQQMRAPRIAHIDDGRLKTNRTRAAVEDVSNFRAQPGSYVLGGGGAHVAEGICARGGEWQAGQPEQTPEQRMCGHTHGDAWKTGGDDAGYDVAFREDQSERSRPVGGGELSGRVVGDREVVQFCEGPNVNDEGIGKGPALRAVDRRAGLRVKGIGGQTVNRLGGHGHESAGTQHAGEPGEVSRSAGKHPGVMRRLGHPGKGGGTPVAVPVTKTRRQFSISGGRRERALSCWRRSQRGAVDPARRNGGGRGPFGDAGFVALQLGDQQLRGASPERAGLQNSPHA